MRSAVTLIRRVPGWMRLAVVGLAIVAIYFVIFGGRYPLARYWRFPLQSLATLNRNSLDSALWYIGSFAALFGLYWLGASLLKQPSFRLWLIMGGGAVLFNLALLPMLPFDAADIYDYIIRGRMTAFYGLNPMKDVPTQVANDPLYRYSAWHEATSAYGPAWESIAALLARVAGSDPTTNVIVFKLLFCAGYAGTAILIGLTLHTIAPERALLGAYLFAWNPLTPYFAGGNGHNDMVMAACIMLSLFCLARRWYVGSALAAIVGALIKFVPLLLLPVIAIIMWRELRGTARFKTFSVAILLCGATIIAFYLPYWTGIESLAIDRRERLFTGSVGTLIRQALEPMLGTTTSGIVVSTVALGLFSLFYVWQLVRLSHDRDPLHTARILTQTLLFYLLAATIWFQPWYVVWVLPVAVLLDDSPARRLTLWFSYLVTWQPLLYNYVTLRYNGWMPLPWRDLIPVSVVMGGAGAYVGWYWISHINRRTEASAVQS